MSKDLKNKGEFSKIVDKVGSTRLEKEFRSKVLGDRRGKTHGRKKG